MNIRYGRIAPDVTDIENRSEARPGYYFQIAENDGGVMIEMRDADKLKKSGLAGYKGIFVGYTEAEEIIQSLQEAVDLAKNKGQGKDSHSGRVHDP